MVRKNLIALRCAELDVVRVIETGQTPPNGDILQWDPIMPEEAASMPGLKRVLERLVFPGPDGTAPTPDMPPGGGKPPNPEGSEGGSTKEPNTSGSTEPDDFTVLPDVGAASELQLRQKLKLATYDDIAAADPAVISKRVKGISLDGAKRIVAEAKKLVEARTSDDDENDD